MRRECVLLYPPPPRKQPDVWRCLGAPHGMGIRKTVSNEGSQGSRETVNRVHAQNASAVWTRWDRGSPLGSSFHQDCFLFPQDRRPSCCSPPVSSPVSHLSHNLQTGTVIRRGPAPEPALRMAFGASWPSEQRGKRAHHRQLCFRKSK